MYLVEKILSRVGIKTPAETTQVATKVMVVMSELSLTTSSS